MNKDIRLVLRLLLALVTFISLALNYENVGKLLPILSQSILEELNESHQDALENQSCDKETEKKSQKKKRN